MPAKALQTLGRLAREKRGTRGLRDAAREIGISPATLMRVENGRIPDVTTFGKLCAWVGVDPAEFICDGLSKNRLGGAAIAAPILSVHLKSDRTPDPKTVSALAQMILLAMKHQGPREIE